jgi:RHS repeat-associated protein
VRQSRRCTGILRNTRYTTLGDGLTVSAAYRYDAYGNVSAFAGTDTTALKFAGGHGYQSDGPNSLQLLGARHYDPLVGRFLNPDPIGFAGGLNLYGYCDGDPVNYVDPDGRFKRTLKGTARVGGGLALRGVSKAIPVVGSIVVIGDAVYEIARYRPGAPVGPFTTIGELLGIKILSVFYPDELAADPKMAVLWERAHSRRQVPCDTGLGGGGGGGGGGGLGGGGGGGPRDPLHHVFPQNPNMFVWFYRRGINPDAWTVPMDTDYLRWLHREWIHRGSGSGGIWNAEWQAFMDAEAVLGRRYTTDEIWAKARDMMRRYDIPENWRYYPRQW